jgi:hypothetical protein
MGNKLFPSANGSRVASVDFLSQPSRLGGSWREFRTKGGHCRQSQTVFSTVFEGEMMFRKVLTFLVLTLILTPVAADQGPPQAAKPTVDLAGDIKDESLQSAAPANGVIVSPKAWEKLAQAWGIKDAPKVDFTKEILIVGTWKGSTFNITPMIQDGDLTVSSFGTKDLREGFRWKVRSIPREGIKTVQGRPLPTE